MVRLAVLAAMLAAAAPAGAQETVEELRAQLAKAKADADVLQRQLEVLHTQLQEAAFDRDNLKRAYELARSERDGARAEAAKRLAALEELRGELARGGKLKDPAPGRLIEAKITAVDTGVGIVVLSVGRDDGVLEGTDFTVYRAGEFVANVTIDKVDRKWSAARVTLKKSDVRIADDASTGILKSGRDDVDLAQLRRDLDDARRRVREVSDTLLPSWKDSGFAAEPVSDELKAHLALEAGLLVRRVRDDSPAALAGLKAHDVVTGSDEAGLAAALKSGAAIRLVRAGRPMTLNEAK